jgi:hypothetical protein
MEADVGISMVCDRRFQTGYSPYLEVLRGIVASGGDIASWIFHEFEHNQTPLE